MEKVIPGNGVAGVHQVCSSGILNLSPWSHGFFVKGGDCDAAGWKEKQYTTSDITLKSVSKFVWTSRTEVVGAWLLKGMKINVVCVFCCHFPPEGLKEPPKQIKSHLWDFSRWLYWIFTSIIIVGLFVSHWADFLPSSSYHCAPYYLPCVCHVCCFLLLYHYLSIPFVHHDVLKLRSTAEHISWLGCFLQGLCAMDRISTGVLTMIGVEYQQRPTSLAYDDTSNKAA